MRHPRDRSGALRTPLRTSADVLARWFRLTTDLGILTVIGKLLPREARHASEVFKRHATAMFGKGVSDV